MSFAPRFLLLFTLVLFPWGCGQDDALPIDENAEVMLDLQNDLPGEIPAAQAEQLLKHLNRGEVQEAIDLLSGLNQEQKDNENPKVLLMALHLLNGNPDAALILAQSWPAGKVWFDRLQARHQRNQLLGDITYYLGQVVEQNQNQLKLGDTANIPAASLANPLGANLPGSIDRFIPLQRSEVNNALNVAFEVDATTTAITIHSGRPVVCYYLVVVSY